MSKVVLIAGATGMVGKRVLERALEQEEISKVIVYGRSSVDFKHSKMEEVLSPIFDQFPVALLDQLPKVDHILFCVGVYTGAVKRELFREITVDYPVELAKKHLEANPSGAFSLLSGQGADRTEKSRMMFAMDKGVAENALCAMYGGRFFSFRPGYIYPVIKRKEPNFPTACLDRCTRCSKPLALNTASPPSSWPGHFYLRAETSGPRSAGKPRDPGLYR